MTGFIGRLKKRICKLNITVVHIGYYFQSIKYELVYISVKFVSRLCVGHRNIRYSIRSRNTHSRSFQAPRPSPGHQNIYSDVKWAI